MSAHVLLNLSNELGKIDTMLGLPQGINKFNNTGARMSDHIYYVTIRSL